MGRPKTTIPKYSIHKASGQAVTHVNGKTVYLGKHNSPASRQAYGELLARLAAQSMLEKTERSLPVADVTVAELCIKFVTDELPRYSPQEQHCQKTVFVSCGICSAKPSSATSARSGSALSVKR